MSKRVLLADCRVLLRQALRSWLEQEGFKVIAQASDCLEAITLAKAWQPDLAILDVHLPRTNGLDAARQIRRASPAAGVILLIDNLKGSLPLEALQSGVRGGVYLAPPATSRLLGMGRIGTTYEDRPLTARGRQVLQLIAEGKTTKEVAALLRITFRTADYHRTHLMRTLNIHDTAGLVRYAIRAGLISP